MLKLLDDLNDRKITGHSAIQAMNSFVRDHSDYKDLIWSILDRNLKTRSTTAMINKIIPGLVPVYEVALALTYDSSTSKKVDWTDGWFVSRKLDGVRCICTIDAQGEPTFFSRKGNEFLTLGKLKEDIKKLDLSNMVLDGEVCVVDENGNENFTTIVSEIKRKDFTVENPKYMVFDLLTKEEFEAKKSDRRFAERFAALVIVLGLTEVDRIEEVSQARIANEIDLLSRIQKAKELGWEGLMLRKNSTYKGKRSDELLKVKAFHDAEYVVVGTENSISRIIVEGKEVEIESLKNIIVVHRGCRVQVGSGFSHEQRKLYYEHPELIVGKEVKVQYFEETKNQNGGYSLRFPTFKVVYENRRDF